jgi:hypothetical protein
VISEERRRRDLMPLQHIDSKHTTLRQAGYGERWLQDLLEKDPSLLGLGDLKSIAREVRQNAGGRLDLLMADLESDIMYEVEIMLGATDESHIIRTIEYWDIERRKRPSKQHRAVIVAEEITNRFFNVIWLLSQSLPIIAIKLDALEVDGKLAISFTKVLNVYETPEIDDSEHKGTTPQVWIDYASKDSYEVFEKVVELISSSGRRPRITYNVDHIAVSVEGSKRNFAWFSPRRKSHHCVVELRVGDAILESVVQECSDAGLDASRIGSSTVRMRLTPADLTAKKEAIRKAVNYAIAEGDGI